MNRALTLAASRIQQDATAAELASLGALAFDTHTTSRDELKATLYRLWYAYDHLFVFTELALAAYDFQRDTTQPRLHSFHADDVAGYHPGQSAAERKHRTS